MPKEILVHVAQGERRVAILDNGALDNFLIELDRHESMLGNIYKGKVESILPSINGAFVNIGWEKNGFLYLTDADNPMLDDLEIEKEEGFSPQKFIQKILKPEDKKPKKSKRRTPRKKVHETALKEGQEILVQVVKDPFGNKGPRLTTHITLPGRFVVYMPVDTSGGISKKISDVNERKRLRDIVKGFTFAKTGCFIGRTVCEDQKKNDIIRDGKLLVERWEKILKMSKRKSAPFALYQEGALLWKITRDFLNDDVKSVWLDTKEDFDMMKKYVQTYVGREGVKKIKLHKGRRPLFEARRISRELNKVYDQKVMLKSGAYIIIEQTEAFIVVDVNSGKYRDPKRSPDEAAFDVNMEAAVEIARQLRLRDLGGIIVLDFIDMIKHEHKRKLVAALKQELAKDYSKTEVYPISALGLVEMTRARAGRTLESMKFKSCTYCGGRGKIKID